MSSNAKLLVALNDPGFFTLKISNSRNSPVLRFFIDEENSKVITIWLLKGLQVSMLLRLPWPAQSATDPSRVNTVTSSGSVTTKAPPVGAGFPN